MGFNLFGSSKKTNTTTQNTTYTDETGVQVSGDESVGVGNAENVLITDGGAFADAVAFGRDVLEIPGAALDAVVDTSAKALDAFADNADRSFEFSEELFGNSLDFAGKFAENQSERYTDFARGIVGDSLEQVADTVKRSQDSLATTVTALNTISREQSKSTDERVQELAKYVVIGVIALGLGFIALRGR
jgi:hypothetical protein